MEKHVKQDTLTDIVLGNENINQPIQLQIKVYGLGHQESGGTTELVKLLNRHRFDDANNEVLIIFLDDLRGFIDVDSLLGSVDMVKFPYREVITIHHSKPDMLTHCVRLKPPSLGGGFGYVSFSQEEVITL
jgi:hypothetical protein